MSGVLSLGRLPKKRSTAFAIHLALSVLIFSTLVGVMLVYWFPGDLFIMDGGWEGLKLVAIVDLVLGPALTLLLYTPGKPGLKMDLTLIAGVQIAALAYGFYTTYNQRTVAVVYAEKQFTTVSASNIKKANMALKDRDLQPGPLPPTSAFNIPLLLTPAPENFNLYIQDILNGYPAGHMRSDQYVALNDHREELQRGRMSSEQLEQLGALDIIKEKANKHKLPLDKIEVYAFQARYSKGFALLDPQSMRIVDYISHAPDSTEPPVAENTN